MTGETPKAPEKTQLHLLVDTYFDSQKFRIRTANRISHFKDYNPSIPEIVEKFDPEAQLNEAASKRLHELHLMIPENMPRDAIIKMMSEFYNALMQDKYQIDNQVFISDEFGNQGVYLINDYKRLEKRIEAKIKNQVNTYPIYKEYLKETKGIGPILAGGLISYIHPISRFDSVSKLWAYAGMDVREICSNCNKRYIVDAKRGEWIERRANRLENISKTRKDQSKVKTHEQCIKEAEALICHCENPVLVKTSPKARAGEMIDWNPELKKLLYLVSDQFVRQRSSPYRKVYEEAKLTYMNRPDLMKEIEKKQKGEVKGTAHIEAMARRKTVKLFLSHLWETWRKLEGLPTPEPYVFSVLGHSDKIDPFKDE
jgi:hypothetical protein